MRIAALLVEIVKLFGGAVRRIRIQALHHVGPAAPLPAAQRGQRVLPTHLQHAWIKTRNCLTSRVSDPDPYPDPH
jgi:hypothetical protein